MAEVFVTASGDASPTLSPAFSATPVGGIASTDIETHETHSVRSSINNDDVIAPNNAEYPTIPTSNDIETQSVRSSINNNGVGVPNDDVDPIEPVILPPPTIPFKASKSLRNNIILCHLPLVSCDCMKKHKKKKILGMFIAS